MTVVCFGAMRDYLPENARNERAMTLSEGATVGDLVDQLGAPRRLAAAILLGDSRGKLTDPLEDGTRVTLMPPFSGG